MLVDAQKVDLMVEQRAAMKDHISVDRKELVVKVLRLDKQMVVLMAYQKVVRKALRLVGLMEQMSVAEMVEM